MATGRDRWRIQVTIGRSPEGKQLYKRRTVHGSRQDAEQALIDLTRQYANAEITGATPSMAQHAEDWLATVNRRRAASTRSATESLVRKHIIGGPFAHKALDRITYRDVQAWLDGMSDQAKDTVLTRKRTLSQILRWGVKRGQIPANPVEFTELPPTRETTPKTSFTVEEAQKFLDACAAADTQMADFFIVSLMLGARPGEAGAIRWSSIDWSGATVYIDKAVKRIASGRPVELGPTKHRKHVRRVTMTAEVIDALERQQVRHEIGRMTGPPMPAEWDGLVFVSLDDGRENWGQPPYRSMLSDHLDELCAAAGVPRVTPYELRHSCASILLDRGVHITTVADMLGTSERMLRDHYHHIINPTIRAGADAWQTIRAER